MPQGLQVWDSAGNLTVDYTDRVMTVLGKIELSSSTPDGTVTVNDSRLALGTRWFFKTATSSGWGGAVDVTVTSASSSITVTASNPSFIPAPMYVTYGIY